jgi:transposase
LTKFPTSKFAHIKNALKSDLAGHSTSAFALTEDLRELARDALGSAETKRLMTIPGIDMVVAVGLLVAIGPIARFPSPGQLARSPRWRSSRRSFL